jgi:hypothetical protein
MNTYNHFCMYLTKHISERENFLNQAVVKIKRFNEMLFQLEFCLSMG